MIGVLNLTIAMMLKILFQIAVAINLLSIPIFSVTPGLYITSPISGETIQGIVEIKGSTPEESFSYAELVYAFEGTSEQTWFLMQKFDHPIQDGLFALWDTTTITDGLYRLRLRVFQTNGEVKEIIVERILVSNYSQQQGTRITALPQTTKSDNPASLTTPDVSIQPTSFSPNPASINNNELKTSFVSGLILTDLILGSVTLYLFFRGVSRK
jgi:hypothetical protein